MLAPWPLRHDYKVTEKTVVRQAPDDHSPGADGNTGAQTQVPNGALKWLLINLVSDPSHGLSHQHVP